MSGHFDQPLEPRWPSARDVEKQEIPFESTSIGPSLQREGKFPVPEQQLGNYLVTDCVGRGAFKYCYRVRDTEINKDFVLSFGDAAGGGKYVTRGLDITNQKSPQAISPDECPADAVFIRSDGARVDFFDSHEIDSLIEDEASKLKLWAKLSTGHTGPARFVKLGDPGLVTVDDRPTLVTELAEGESLRTKIRNLHGIRLNWFLAIARLLERGEKEGLCHGDLKPENIVITPHHKIKLLDPGGKMHDRNVVITTPLYNPFLLSNSKADVMGLGTMLYEIMTGELPFDNVPWEYAGSGLGGAVESLSRSYFLSYPPPKDLNPNTPDSIQRIIYNCLTRSDYGLKEFIRETEAFLKKH